jgi:hypothetical protein
MQSCFLMLTFHIMGTHIQHVLTNYTCIALTSNWFVRNVYLTFGGMLIIYIFLIILDSIGLFIFSYDTPITHIPDDNWLLLVEQ